VLHVVANKVLSLSLTHRSSDSETDAGAVQTVSQSALHRCWCWWC